MRNADHAFRISRSHRVLLALQYDDRVSVPKLAAAMGVPYETLKSYVQGRYPFPADLAPALYRALVPVDRALALWAFEAIVGLHEIGHEAAPLPAGTDPDPVHVDALQVSEALGRVAGLLAQAPVLVSHRAREILPHARTVRLEAWQLVTKLGLAVDAGPQCSIAGVR